MIHYARILQTGLQSLLAVACGWACGRWQVVEAEPTVHFTNTLVLRFCIPCLQVWLLAFKTDMRQADNWRALGVFLVWSVSLQALLAAHQLLSRRRLQLDRLGVDGLILTTNNTGILGPVVLEAAVGQQFAPLGMLATVVLYFQQLPLAQLLFQLHQQQQPQQQWQQPSRGHRSPGQPGRPQKFITSPEPQQAQETCQLANGCDACSGRACQRHGGGRLQHLHHPHHHQEPQQGAGVPPLLPAPHRHRGSSHGSEGSLQSLGRPHGQQQHHHQQLPGREACWPQHAGDLEQQPADGARPAIEHQLDAACGQEGRPLLLPQQPHLGGAAVPDSAASYVLALLLKNPLVWSTGVAVLLSALGSAALLDPGSPLAIKQLAFLEALLGWFAQTTAPLTLFTTGLWMYSNSEQRARTGAAPAAAAAGRSLGAAVAARGPVGAGASQVAAAAGTASESLAAAGFGSRDVAWADLLRYLLLRATAAPALMVALCWLCGFHGDWAHALVILALLPVAQTAFVVCKQADVGMAAVSSMLVASLLVMLPQLMTVLALLEGSGVFGAGSAAAAPAAERAVAVRSDGMPSG